MKKIIIFLALLILPLPAFALEDTRPQIIIWFIVLFWILGLLFFLTLLIKFIVKKFQQKKLSPKQLVDSAGTYGLKKTILRLGVVLAIPVIILIASSFRLFTFSYEYSENVAEKIYSMQNDYDQHEVESYSSIVGRIYVITCADVGGLYSQSLIPSAQAQVNVNAFSDMELKLGCSPFDATYFNAKGDRIAYCGIGLPCFFLGYRSEKIDRVYP